MDEWLNNTFAPVSDLLTEVVFFDVEIQGVQIPLIVIWLASSGLITTLYLGFPNVRYFAYGIRTLFRRSDKDDSTPVIGDTSPFQALTAALSSTVGLGNIAGVAIAISLGGPGATLWMIVAGFLGMATKCSECLLGVKYRDIRKDGSVSGGPMYYIVTAFSNLGMKKVGTGVAIFFAIACLLGNVGSGGMFQLNQAFSQFIEVTGGENSLFIGYGWLFGCLISTSIGWIVLGGIKSIVKVTEKLVPFMAAGYLLLSISYLLANSSDVLKALELIFLDAFDTSSAMGGVIGAMVHGVRRAAFSNEAGIGTAPIAHATVKTNSPASQGSVALLEPFIDTVVICTLTALVIITSGAYLTLGDESGGGISGIQLTSQAFETTFSWVPGVLFFIVFFFSTSTALTSAFYTLKSWSFLTGKESSRGIVIFYCIALVLGTSMDLRSVIDFSDSTFFIMSIPNLIAVYILLPEVKREMSKMSKEKMIYKRKR